jgi:hypothetical protein
MISATASSVEVTAAAAKGMKTKSASSPSFESVDMKTNKKSIVTSTSSATLGSNAPAVYEQLVTPVRPVPVRRTASKKNFQEQQAQAAVVAANLKESLPEPPVAAKKEEEKVLPLAPPTGSKKKKEKMTYEVEEVASGLEATRRYEEE